MLQDGSNPYDKISAMSQYYMAYTKDDVIYSQTNKIIGYTDKKYQEAVATAEGFQEALYEHGVLERPKTPEDIARETQEELNQTKKMLHETQEAQKQILEKLDLLMKKEESADDQQESAVIVGNKNDAKHK